MPRRSGEREGPPSSHVPPPSGVCSLRGAVGSIVLFFLFCCRAHTGKGVWVKCAHERPPLCSAVVPHGALELGRKLVLPATLCGFWLVT